MTNLASTYDIPDEVMTFVRDGILEIVSEDEAKKTVEFHIPSQRRTDDQGRVTTFSVVWIHPDYNAKYCHYFDKTPGDLPNFYALEDTTNVGDELVDGLNTVDDLVAWIEGLRVADSY